MQRVALLLLILCLSWIPATADTTWVQGPVNGTWTAASSPYFVGGPVSVPFGATLTIEPGVLVRFWGSYSISVSGTIFAHGTEAERIRFTADTLLIADGWQGIRVAAGHADLSFCTIEHAAMNISGEQIASAVNLSASTATITDCIFQHNRARPPLGVYNGSEATVERCLFSRNILTYGCCGGGIGVRGNSHVDISDCEFFANECLDGAGVYVNDGSTANIIGCYFHNNHAHSFGGAVHVAGSGEVLLSKSVLLYNDAYAGGGAIQARGSNFRIEQCTFDGNVCYQPGAQISCDGGPTVINSCVFAPFNGQFGIGAALNVLANTQITHSLIYVFFTDDNFAGTLPDSLGSLVHVNANGTPCDPYFNIYVDPQFVNSAQQNFALAQNSPCIDAGDPALDLDPDSTIADLGAYYYDQATAADPRSEALPRSPVLYAAYPNPFNPSTTLSFALSTTSHVSLRIVDLLGREVAALLDRDFAAGEHSLQWNAADLPSGLYFAVFHTGTHREVQKLVLMK